MMIKIAHGGRHVMYTLRAIITCEKRARILKRLGEPFIQHCIILIVVVLLALSLGCTLLAPRPNTIARMHTRTDLLSDQSLIDHTSSGQQGRKGTQDQ